MVFLLGSNILSILAPDSSCNSEAIAFVTIPSNAMLKFSFVWK